MKSMKRVVVTGMGAITPIGNSVEEFWNGIKEQKIGFAPITYFDATEYKAHLAAEVKGFNAKDYMSPKAARRMELFSQYAVAATKEAIEDAGLDLEKEDTTRIGVSVGCGVGSLQMIETTTRTLDKKGPIQIVWSASWAWSASLSASEQIATDMISISRHARMIRTAISPLFAIKIFLNI